jgi:hypothetical protein
MMIENMDVCTVCNQDIQPLSNDEVFQIFPPPPSDDFLDMKKLEETIGQGKVKLQGIETSVEAQGAPGNRRSFEL